MNVTPIKDGFENPKAFLLHIAEDSEITGFAICVLRSTGSMIPTHINLSVAEVALAGVMLTKLALSEE